MYEKKKIAEIYDQLAHKKSSLSSIDGFLQYIVYIIKVFGHTKGLIFHRNKRSSQASLLSCFVLFLVSLLNNNYLFPETNRNLYI